MIDCGACDGKGEYATDHEGFNFETCASCEGTGEETCFFCDEPASEYVWDLRGGKLQKTQVCESCYKDFPADDRCATG